MDQAKAAMMKKIGIKMTVSMGVVMSFILSLVGTLMGGHFTVPSWLISFVISLLISLVIGFIVPIKKVGDAFCNKCKTNPESMKGNLLSGIVSDLIYTPLITVIMVVVMLGNAAKHAPAGAVPTVGQVLPGSLLVCLIVGYVVIIIVQPILLKTFMKGIQK